MDRVSVSHKHIKPVVPLYRKLEYEHNMKSKLWYEQFSRKEIAKLAGESQRSVSEESFNGNAKATRRAIRTFNNPGNRLKVPVHRHTDMNINSNVKKLERVDKIDQINDEIRRLEKAIKKDNKALDHGKLKKVLKPSASSTTVAAAARSFETPIVN